MYKKSFVNRTDIAYYERRCADVDKLLAIMFDYPFNIRSIAYSSDLKWLYSYSM